MTQRTLLVSRHDYRTGWRANTHFLADAYRDLGHTVEFVSVGFSPLSLLSHDHRKNLYPASNRWHEVDGINCFLWRSTIHPFGRGLGPLQKLTNGLFDWWIHSSCPDFDDACRRADLIVVESGIGAALFGRIRRAAPDAAIVYLVSDLLETVGAHPFIGEQLYRDRDAIDLIAVVARAMAPHFESFGCPVRFVPHGIPTNDFERPVSNPYGAGRNIVTVGSMLFDEDFFRTAARQFPDVTFHLIGTPKMPERIGNVIEYGRMPFHETLPYLKYAEAGVAPYRHQEHAGYLADSSMKLMQYEYLKRPAICPHFAVGGRPGRHGYEPDNPASIEAAVRDALAKPFEEGDIAVLDWTETARELMRLDQRSQAAA